MHCSSSETTENLMQQLRMSVDCKTLQGHELDPTRMANADSSQPDNGMTLIAVLLCTLMRGTKLQEAKVRCRIYALCELT